MIRVPTIVRCALTAAGAVLLVGAPAAQAEDTTIVLGGPAARSLADHGVRIAAVKPAKAVRRGIALPTGAVTVSGATATVEQRGGLRLRAGRRAVTLTAIQVRVGARSTLSAAIDGERRTVATIDAPGNRHSVQASGAYVTESPLRLTGATVELLRRELRRPRLGGGRLGTLDLEATTSLGSTTDIPGAPSAPTVTGPPTPGGATLTARPSSAVAISGGTARWSPRTSWLGYLESGGEPASATAPASIDGTTYTLPISGGWFDAASGKAVVTTAGSTVFRYPSHSIDMVFADWSYDLAGATPKAVATVAAASGSGKALVGTKQPIGLVKLGGAAPSVSADGTTVTWSDVPLTLAAEGVPIFRAYLYDSEQGRVTITATIG